MSNTKISKPGPTTAKRKMMQFEPIDGVSEKIAKIAEVNKLSIKDVGNLCLAAGLNIVEEKFDEMVGRNKAA